MTVEASDPLILAESLVRISMLISITKENKIIKLLEYVYLPIEMTILGYFINSTY